MKWVDWYNNSRLHSAIATSHEAELAFYDTLNEDEKSSLTIEPTLSGKPGAIQSMRLTRALGFNATPSFVIGDDLVPGFIEQEQLEAVVDKTRDSD